MENVATLDWRGCFNVPTLSELKGKRDVSVVPSIVESQIVSQRSKVLKSAVFVLKTASITCAILTLAPVIGGAIGASLGLTTAHAMVASTSFAGATYVAGSSHAVVTAMAPVVHSTVQATADAVGWDRLIKKVLWIVDYLMDGVIIFSGISWMFGNRTKAIELLLGAGVGYVIVRHHEDIKNFFALL